jgi:Flp pilus assembly protein CpaB
MKLTTFFAIAVALLLGVGVLFASQKLGWFERPAQAKEVREEPKPAPIKILVASDNLFEGILITSASKVKVREATAREIRDFQANSDKFMPATANAVVMRVPNRHIPADTPLLKEYFEEQNIPDSPTAQIEPGMRAVNLAVPKNRCVGGIVRKGDHVDVMLTSKMFPQGEVESAIVRTACIARNVRIVIKRNQLWTTLSANPDDKPVDYTLELNPYRAALLDFAQEKGQISLVAVAAPLQKIAAGNYSDPTSKEYADEDERVESVVRGEYTISDLDLNRIFQIKPVAPPPPPTPPTIVRHIGGTKLEGITVIGADGKLGAFAPAPSNAPPPSMIFLPPDAATDPKSCPTCGKPPKKY